MPTPQRVGVVDQAAADFDDSCLVTELSNPAKCFDQSVGFLDCLFHSIAGG